MRTVDRLAGIRYRNRLGVLSAGVPKDKVPPTVYRIGIGQMQALQRLTPVGRRLRIGERVAVDRMMSLRGLGQTCPADRTCPEGQAATMEEKIGSCGFRTPLLQGYNVYKIIDRWKQMGAAGFTPQQLFILKCCGEQSICDAIAGRQAAMEAALAERDRVNAQIASGGTVSTSTPSTVTEYVDDTQGRYVVGTTGQEAVTGWGGSSTTGGGDAGSQQGTSLLGEPTVQTGGGVNPLDAVTGLFTTPEGGTNWWMLAAVAGGVYFLTKKR